MNTPVNASLTAGLFCAALLAFSQAALAQYYEPQPLEPFQPQPVEARPVEPRPVEPLAWWPADGSCPGVTGWVGHQCHGMSGQQFFGFRYVCDALCTMNGGDIINGQASGRDAVPAGEADVRVLELDDAGRLRIETRDPVGGCSSRADTVVQVHHFGPNGWAQLGPEHDDVVAGPNDPVGRCETIEISVPAGRYAVRIDGYDDLEVREYIWRISATVEAAGTGDYAGETLWLGDDRFEVTLAAPGQVCTGDGQGGCPGDTVVSFESPPPGYAPSDDDGGVNLCSCLDMPVGTHTVRVTGYNDEALPPYVLMVP